MQTEEQNPRTRDLDRRATLEVVQLINAEDGRVAAAVSSQLSLIAQAVDLIAERLSRGGRIFYVGAGTSGRLGILDAVECPPTFNVEPTLVQGILAGGYEACYRAVEAEEDSEEQGRRDLEAAGVHSADAVIGIAASGRTPYTCAAVARARNLGALTVGISCNASTRLSAEAEIAIEVVTGPEALSGSTRMKAGTAQKMVLNLISTATMVRLGHVYDNLMVNVHLKNEKLIRRGVSIVQRITDCAPEDAERALAEAGAVKTAVVMITFGCSRADAQARLESAGGCLRAALEG